MMQQILLGLGSGGIDASGGTKTTSGGDTIHTFLRSSGATQSFVVNSGSFDIQLLMVAGGGGGGSGRGAGGGGAGGLIYFGPESPNQGSGIPVTPGTYSITIGAGGADDTDGGDTTGFSRTALGGGTGRIPAGTANPGGSGGAGRHNESITGGTGDQPGHPSGGYGNPGGPASPGTNTGAGGGGAGGTGGPTAGNNGFGGPGMTLSISGLLVLNCIELVSLSYLILPML